MDYKHASDIELWQCCRQDDIRAYNALFDRYAKLLYRQATGYVKDTMDAEELVMDLLFNLWQKRGHLQPDAGNNVRAYLMHAMRNRIINYLQKNIPAAANSIEILAENTLVESRQADYSIISKDMETVYRSNVDKLSPRRREVFKLSREQNLSYAEIAQQMNLSVNTVENYMVSALSTLREQTKEYHPLISLFLFVFIR
ncbi:RNA polymerase sigma-70 factor [Chitinophaga barathri]|uniref:RNA polymerase sigma-70 factor n=1 Tax=Chitinophaga barathri TaxID=1647451 RepID=A0A3N4MJ33_9BACT|nr:RNA polymerase sigma-70 factor [Chitinophaga barathri]RPD42066.1 RNA polymerase sigma-70 factor [Chitinophaga barathri]